MGRLNGKIAIITGAGCGIGRAIATSFAREGAKVVVTDINGNRAATVAAAIKNDGGEAVFRTVNVALEEHIQDMVDWTASQFGTVDILVNNAGIMDNFVTAGEVTDELWDKVFAVNLQGPLRATRKVLPIFTQKGEGIIINISSIAGLCGSRAGAAYTASKHALMGLTKNVGYQYADAGIRCNAIAAGAVETNIGETIDDPSELGQAKSFAGISLNPRIAQPEEIADIALFLATKDSSFVNGTVITADSGWTAY